MKKVKPASVNSEAGDTIKSFFQREIRGFENQDARSSADC